MGAVFSPYGSAAFKNNVVKWAFFCAFAAADAGFTRIKSVGLYKKTVKQRVYRAAHKAVVQVASGRGKGLAGFYARNCLRNGGLGFLTIFSACSSVGALNMAI